MNRRAPGGHAPVGARPPHPLILRSERSERLEGWAMDTAFVAHPSRRAEAGAPQDEGVRWIDVGFGVGFEDGLGATGKMFHVKHFNQI